MKHRIGIILLLLATLVIRASSTNQTFTATSGATIPDANPVGITSTLNVSSMSGGMTNLTVQLNISGGFTGDLYAYLVSPTGGLVVLLNRVGVGTGNPFGYADAGFDITFDAAGANIHNYQAGSYTITGGQLTGTWAPDQRTIAPNSIPSAFDASPTGNNLDYFNNYNPNGVWTLFVADLAAGGQSTLVSWGLTVVTVPEPQTWMMVGGGFAAFILARRRK